MFRSWVARTLCGLIVVLVALSYARAGQVTLRWNANAETDLAGYIVYIGTSSGDYLQGIDVSLTATPWAPETTLGDLVAGNTYYFTLTAYDIFGNEGGFSNEVAKTVFDSPGPCMETGTSRIWGKITNQISSTGILDVTLNLTGPSGCTATTTTKSWGLFWSAPLGNGTYTIIPEKVGCTFEPSEQTVTLADDTVRTGFVGTCP
jgi:hypothetical protein